MNKYAPYLLTGISAIALLWAAAGGAEPRRQASSTGGLYAIASADGVVVYRMTRDGVTCFVVTMGVDKMNANPVAAISCVGAAPPAQGAWSK